jgi:hypothetical protein
MNSECADSQWKRCASCTIKVASLVEEVALQLPVIWKVAYPPPSPGMKVYFCVRSGRALVSS